MGRKPCPARAAHGTYSESFSNLHEGCRMSNRFKHAAAYTANLSPTVFIFLHPILRKGQKSRRGHRHSSAISLLQNNRVNADRCKLFARRLCHLAGVTVSRCRSRLRHATRPCAIGTAFGSNIKAGACWPLVAASDLAMTLAAPVAALTHFAPA